MSREPVVNKHGLDAGTVRTALTKIKSDTKYYRADELARDLASLAFSIHREAAINKINVLEEVNTTSLAKT